MYPIIGLILFLVTTIPFVQRRKARQAKDREATRARELKSELNAAVISACNSAAHEHSVALLDQLKLTYSDAQLSEFESKIAYSRRDVAEWRDAEKRQSAQFMEALNAYRCAQSPYAKLLATIQLFSIGGGPDSAFTQVVRRQHREEVARILGGALSALAQCQAELEPRMMDDKKAFEQMFNLMSHSDSHGWRIHLGLPRLKPHDRLQWRVIVAQHKACPVWSDYPNDSSFKEGELRRLAVTAIEDNDASTAKFVLAWCNSLHERHLKSIGVELAAQLDRLVLLESRSRTS